MISFDRVNHDILIDRLQKLIGDPGVIRLRAYLNSGITDGGVVGLLVAAKPLLAFKRRIRELPRRSGGRSMKDVVERLRDGGEDFSLFRCRICI